MPNCPRALAVAVVVAGLVACAKPPEPSRPIEPQPSAPHRLATFSVTITPPSRGPGMGQTPGSALWQVVPEGRDGNPNTNPARTIQLRSTAPFAVAATGLAGSCPNGAIHAPVEIKNYFPERLTDVYVVLTQVSGTNHGLCQPGTRPPFAVAAGVGTGIEYINYVTPSTTTPWNKLAGSQWDDGRAPGGGSNIVEWYFAYATPDNAPFTIKGEVWANLRPDIPVIAGGDWFIGESGNGVLRWFVFDRDDDPGNPAYIVSNNETLLCGVPFNPDGTCPGGSLWSPVLQPALTSSGVDTGYLRFLPAGLTGGATYHVRIRSSFDNGAGPVLGSYVLERSILACDPPVQTAPAANATVTSPIATFQWDTNFAYPFFVPVPEANPPVVQICAHENCCATPPCFTINTATEETPLIGVTGPQTGISVVGGEPARSFTAAIDISGLAPSTTYHWRVRNLYPFREGLPTPTRPFRTPP